MKKADRSGARIALILGESEVQKSTVQIKYLRRKTEQFEIAQTQLAQEIDQIINQPESLEAS
jgi:histidyl-tRNA synthetase